MGDNGDRPQWIVYREYFNKRANGKRPRHLYDGYKGDTASKDFVNRGPFSESSKSDYDDISRESISSKFPEVTLILPSVANADRARATIKEEHDKALEVEYSESQLPQGQ